MFLHAQSTISLCYKDSFHLEIRIQTKHRLKNAPLKSSPGEKCLNLECYCCDCSALDYDTFWPAHVKFNDKGFFNNLNFPSMCLGEIKKSVSLINERAGNKHLKNHEGHVCALMPDGIMMGSCVDVLSGRLSINGRNLHSFYVEWQGFSFHPLFFWAGRSKDPHTVQ